MEKLGLRQQVPHWQTESGNVKPARGLRSFKYNLENKLSVDLATRRVGHPPEGGGVCEQAREMKVGMILGGRRAWAWGLGIVGSKQSPDMKNCRRCQA